MIGLNDISDFLKRHNGMIKSPLFADVLVTCGEYCEPRSGRIDNVTEHAV